MQNPHSIFGLYFSVTKFQGLFDENRPERILLRPDIYILHEILLRKSAENIVESFMEEI